MTVLGTQQLLIDFIPCIIESIQPESEVLKFSYEIGTD